MKNLLVKIEDIFQYMDKLFALIVMGGMVYLIGFSFLNVFFRYFLQSSMLYWADELLRYSMVWFIFLGAVLGVSRKLHVKIDVVQKYLPEKLCYWFTLAGYLCMFVFCVVMARQGFLFAATGRNMVSASLALRMHRVYMVMPVSFILMALNIVRLIVREYILKNHPACSGWEDFL